jgi:small-conductance mechanosensitive channel
MSDEGKKSENIRHHRYLTALVFIILFIFAVIALDKLINFLIIRYFPSYVAYTTYVSDGLNVILGIFGAYIIYRILLSLLSLRERKETNISGSELGKVILRILFYIVAVSIVFVAFGPSLGITLSQSLAGGAIGGIIIGLAVQTVVTSILSGFLVSSSRTITPGDVVVLYSSLWGSLICKVVRVNVLFTQVITQTGNRIKLPNTTLFSSTTFTSLRQGDSYFYTIQVSIASDVHVTEFDRRVRIALKENLSKLKKKVPQIYLFSRAAAMNTFNVSINFSDFSEINDIIDITNKTFDDVYWALKIPQQQNLPSQSKKTPAKHNAGKKNG